MSRNDDTQVLGLLALELAGGSTPTQASLPQAQAGALAERVARDLAALVPEAAELDLSFAAAHFDPAEALRPGWPLHRRLAELHARAPGRGQGPRIIALGADRDGQTPQPLQADASLQGGALRVLPFLLSGDPAIVARVGAACEAELLERGMAQPDTALLAQDGLGAQIEHARYLTVHDLAALMSMQYEHQGLAPLWPLIETALLAPAESHWLDTAPEPLLRYADTEVRMALFDPAGWCAHYAQQRGDCERLERVYELFLARQRQLAAVLEAHGLPVLFVHTRADQDARVALEA